jgi:uncharacterized protein
MMDINNLILNTITFFEGDAKRIQHFIKVHSFAKLIAEAEGMEGMALNTLEAAAVVHDVGIKPAEAKYGRCDGKMQEQEGPAVARPLLTECGATAEQVERICFLIAHHNTYSHIDSPDYQILVEADFLVNIYEDAIPSDEVATIRRRIFRTETGISLLDKCFGCL